MFSNKCKNTVLKVFIYTEFTQNVIKSIELTIDNKNTPKTPTYILGNSFLTNCFFCFEIRTFM